MDSRNTLRGTASLVVALIASVAWIGCEEGDDDRRDRDTFRPRAGLAFQEPRELVSRDGELATTLSVAEGELEVSQSSVRGKAYDGSFPGPTMRVHPGDWIRLRFENKLDQTTNIHFHGFHTSPSGVADNVLRSIPARSKARVEVPVPEDMRPGVYWYHSHEHGKSEEQVFGGLSGVIVVEGLSEVLPVELRGITERVIALKDLQAREGAIVTEDIDSNAPTTRTVNGLVAPTLKIRPGETQLWRLANISADIWYSVVFEGRRLAVVGEDANPVGETWSARELLLPPGKRFDVLVRGPDEGTYRLETKRLSTGPAGDTYPQRTLATIESSGSRATPLSIPGSLGPLPDLGEARIDRRRHFVFSEKGNDFLINGKKFDHHRVDVRSKLGSTEEWVIRNSSREQHPFHIHINDFQVMSVDGRPYNARSLQDTQPLPVGGEVVIRMRFTRFPGKFVYHCHILAHEDNGMMGLVEVTE